MEVIRKELQSLTPVGSFLFSVLICGAVIVNLLILIFEAGDDIAFSTRVKFSVFPVKKKGIFFFILWVNFLHLVVLFSALQDVVPISYFSPLGEMLSMALFTSLMI